MVTQWWLEMGLVPNCLMSAWRMNIIHPYAHVYIMLYIQYIYIHTYIHTQYMHDTRSISIYIFTYIHRNTETYEFPSDVQMKPLCKLVSLRSSFDLFDASICICFFVSSKYPPVIFYQTILVNIDSLFFFDGFPFFWRWLRKLCQIARWKLLCAQATTMMF